MVITSCFQPKSLKQPVKRAFTLSGAGECVTSPNRYVHALCSLHNNLISPYILRGQWSSRAKEEFNKHGTHIKKASF